MPTNPKLTSGEMSQIPNREVTLTQSEVLSAKTILSIQNNI